MATLTKKYGLVTIERRFSDDPNGLGVGYFNEHKIEFEAQTRKTVVKYQEEHSMFHCEIMTKRQLDMSESATGISTIG